MTPEEIKLGSWRMGNSMHEDTVDIIETVNLQVAQNLSKYQDDI
jgi:hypothetical protein